METNALHLDYFGVRVRVSAGPSDLAEVAFQAGPHAQQVSDPAPHFDVDIGGWHGGRGKRSCAAAS